MKIIHFLILTFSPLFLLGAEKQFFDYNFDGHDDYRIKRETDGRLVYYDVYLYSDLKKGYERHAGLSELYNPLPNKDKKEIECFWSGGHSGLIYSMEVYEWKGADLVIKHVVRQTDIKVGESLHYIRVTSSVVDGKPRINDIEHINPSLK